MVFLNPLFLWALLGLSIPIAIHFWSKKKVKTIKVGSTQLLKELNPKQTRSISLNHWFLLLLRMLIITLITLIVAMPRIEIKNGEFRMTYLVEPSLLNSEKVLKILDTIAEDQIRLLQPGFPLLEEGAFKDNNKIPPNYWQLAQQMTTLQTDSIIVLTRAFQAGFKGMRPAINLPIHWLLVEDGESLNSVIEAKAVGDQIMLTSVQSDHNAMSFSKETYTLNDKSLRIDKKGDSISIQTERGFEKLALNKISKQRILLVYAEDFKAEVTYLSAAFRALSNYLKLELELTAVNDEQEVEVESFDILVWLKATKSIPFSGKKLLWEPDELAYQLVEDGFSEGQYLLRDHLNAENSIDKDLAQQLIPLFDLHPQLPANPAAYDRRTMSSLDIVAPLVSEDKPAFTKQLEDVSPWLWGFLLFVIPVERILSKYRKQ